MAEKKDCDIIFELGCLVCEKDKIIKQLRKETAELKRLMKLAVYDLNIIYDDYDCRKMNKCNEFCPYSNDEGNCCKGKWKHAEEAMKLLGDDADD